MNRVTLGIVTLETIRPEDSGAVRNAKMSFSIKLHSKTQIWACLMVNPLDMPRTSYRAREEKRSQ